MTTYLGNTIVGIDRTRINVDLANQSKGMESGQISYYKNVYSDILNYAHSTFDKSKFTVVGSPTISDDGIITNTSNLNCVLVNNIDLRTANSWEIDLLINIQDTDLSNNICLVFNTDNRLVFQITPNLHVDSFVNVGTKNINLFSNENIIQQGLNKVKFKYDSSSGYSIFVDDIQVASNTTTSKTIANGSFYIGGGYSTLFMNEPNSIDLKSFAIWVDGVPVFNGNITGTDTINEIQIPYTLSKTGSKIVDVAYRDRVQDLYQQTGEALYYTIDEPNQNFTLPMGEVYGMISNISEDSLNKSQITNCILEIPQDIKFELTDGVLKIKSGSKVYIPNGVNNFDTETISSDITVSLSTGTGTYRVFYRKGGNAAYANQSNVKSGSTPTSNIQGMYYDITLNKISFYQNNTTGDGRLYTFPLAEITITNGVCTSINQIFNGLGYIGSTVFLLPNLKVLLCDGRNADGTLNNYVHVTINCATYSAAGTNPDAYLVIDQKAGVTSRGFAISPKYETDIPNTSLGTFTYNRVDNYIYTYSDIGAGIKRAFIASISVDNGNITSFKANYPFRAVDYNDFYNLQNSSANKDLSNLSESGEKHFLNKTQITNCILEAPNGVATYSGSTFTIKSGLKYLTGIGKNSDGTLLNTQNTLPNDLNGNFTGTSDLDGCIIVVNAKATFLPQQHVYRGGSQPTAVSTSNQIWFDEENNKVYWSAFPTTDWVLVNDLIIVADITSTNTTITSITPYQPFQAVDYNECVTKSTDQNITGTKTFSNNLTIINQGNTHTYHGIAYKNTSVDYTDLQDSQRGARLISLDKNGQYFGFVQTDVAAGTTNLRTYLGVRRNINGVDKQGVLELYITEDGTTYGTAPTYTANYSDNSNKIVTTAYMANHWCTSTPTTSTTASKVRPAVVIENYVNGTNGYRLYSDGYCEQWGVSGGTGNRTVNLLKSYNNTNYCIQLTTNDLEMSYANFDTDSENFTDSSFFIKPSVTNRLVAVYWCTKGYIS